MICVNTLKVSPSSLTLKEGDWYYDATVEICPTNATCSDVRWTSSNTNVATVNETTGYIHAVEKGTATIRAIAQDGSGKTDSIAVTVIEDVKITSIEMCVDKFAVKVGNTYSLCTTIEPINATNPALVWSSSNPSVATVDYNVVRGVSAGTAVITAQATDGSGKRACSVVTVYEATIKILDFTNLNLSTTMGVGETRTLNAQVEPVTAIDKTYKWHSDAPDVITIDEDTGYVTVIGSGFATITATIQDDIKMCDSITIMAENVSITNFSIVSDKNVLDVGENYQLQETVEAISADRNRAVTITPFIHWSSDNEYVATVDPQFGIVTSHNPGTVTITGRIPFANKTATHTFVVANRETVHIEKDSNYDNSDYYNIIFGDNENSVTWKSIGCDLSDSSIVDRTQAEERYYYNAQQTYSEKQLGFIYRFDPLGIVYYMRNYGYSHVIDGDELLLFKDRVYIEIFGVPKLFRKYDNGEIRRYNYYEKVKAGLRYHYHSDAELLFGTHVIFDQVTLDSFRQDLLINIFTSLPVVSDIVSGVELVQALFFSGSIVDSINIVASDELSGYLEDNSLCKTNTKPFKKLTKWVPFVLTLLVTTIETALDTFLEQYDVPTDLEMQTYRKVRDLNYNTVFLINGDTKTIEDAINMFSES